jgi:hypothetical protein
MTQCETVFVLVISIPPSLFSKLWMLLAHSSTNSRHLDTLEGKLHNLDNLEVQWM